MLLLTLSSLLVAQTVLAPEEAQHLRKGLVAVLEFHSTLSGADRKTVDRQFLSDRVRSLLLRDLPEATVIDRENVLVLLRAQGKSLDECEGQCAVDTGRALGADLVVSGDLLKFGGKLALTLRIHASKTGRLLSTEQVSANAAAPLDDKMSAAVHNLLEPVLPRRPPVAPLETAEGRRQQAQKLSPSSPMPGASTESERREAQAQAAQLVRQVADAEARTNLKRCLEGKYPSLCKHEELTGEQIPEVKKAEHRENLRTCLQAKYRSLCNHDDLDSEESAAVHQAEKRENSKVCLDGRYPTLCDHALLDTP